MVESSEKHKQNMRNYMNNKYNNDPEFKKNLMIQMRKHSINKNLRNKNKLYELLGGYRCTCIKKECWHGDIPCIITDKRCLQLDHIKGGGNKERRIQKRLGSSSYYYYLKDKNIKNELQVLCANCNWVKRHLNKEVNGGPKKY